MPISVTDFKWLADALALARKFRPKDWFGSANKVRIPSVTSFDLGVTLPQTGWMRVKFVDLDNREKTLLLEEDLTNFTQTVKGVGIMNAVPGEVVIPGATVVFSTRWVFSLTPLRAIVEFKDVQGVRYRFDGKIPLGKKVSDYFAGLEVYFRKLLV